MPGGCGEKVMEGAPRAISRRSLLKVLGAWALTPRTASTASVAAEADIGAIRAAAEYSAARKGVALVVMRGGKAIFENYPNGHSARERHKIYSGTKGFWILAALKAAEEGRLDLEERVVATIPEWQDDAAKARVTVRQLLNFSAGLDAGNHLHGEDFRDRNAIALRTPLVAPPGRAFIYGPASLQVFHEVLKRKLAGAGPTPKDFLERKVLRPMGLGPQRYLADQAGNPLLATGFMMTARSWARMGQLILDGGRPVISSGSLAQCFRPSPANPAFGMGFWTNALAAHPAAREIDIEDMLEPRWDRQNWEHVCICRDAPRDLVAAIGSGYQRLFVIPSRDLVVVRMGRFGRFSDGKFLRLLLEKA